MVKECDIKRAVSEYVATKASSDKHLQTEAVRGLAGMSVNYLENDGNPEELYLILGGMPNLQRGD